ncbi:MAG TPA: hypothetical protein VGR16_08045, partial [Thermomicrobiales bacterium]|nr:hypothetical protein [Thermomicrobiales bacterium]
MAASGRAGYRVHCRREVVQDPGVEAVGLGQAAGGAGAVADLPWVDHGAGDRGDPQRGGGGVLMAAGGFQDDQPRGTQ